MAKRRPSGDGMVRKRADGRWEGRIVVGHKENGDSIFRYVYAPTQKELTARLRQSIDAYQGVDLTEQCRMTLSQWLDLWLENMTDTLRPNTLRNYRSYIENHIRPNLGDKQLSRITPADVRNFYEKLGGKLSTVTPVTSAKVKANMPFGEWLEYWYENYSKPQLRPNSQRSYEGFIRLYILPKLGNIPLNKLTANDIQQFISWMKRDGRSEYRESRGEGLSDSMIRNCHSLCRRALEQAAAEKLIPQNPAEGCKLPSVRRKEMQLLTREELQKLLIQAKAEGYYEVFLLELTTGLRVGELMALQWDDLNFETGELRIERQVCWVKGELLVQPPKTKASIRTVILPHPVVEALRVYKQTVSSRWIFPSPKKEDAPLAPAAASHRLAKILKHAGCKKVRFHDLRHTFATNALEHGMDVKTLSIIIGHVSSATTLNVYAHITDDMQKQAADKIDRGIGKAVTPVEKSQTKASNTMTDFEPQRGKHRYHGSGFLGQVKGGRWAGRYTVKWPDGKKETRSVYADTEDECEKLLAAMIAEMKAEVAAEKDRLRMTAVAS